MPADLATSVAINIFKGKEDIKNCGMYRGVKHAMKIVEKVLEKRLQKIVTIDDMQFGFTPGKGTIDAVFILRTNEVVHVLCRSGKSIRRCSTKSCGLGNEVERNYASIVWSMK